MVCAARRAVAFAWFWIAALSLFAPAAARAASDDEAAASDEAAAVPGMQASRVPEPLAATTLVFLIPGVRDATTAATVFHCSNPTASNVDFALEYYGPTGAFVCGFYGVLAAGGTSTMTTRNTALFVENGSCDVEGYLPVDKGLARVYISAPVNILCTAQIVDPANATPTYLGSLDVYRP